MKNDYQRIIAAREAGYVERMHCHPHHGSYSVGIHSYNVVNLLLILHPDPSIELIKAAQWHDSGERLIGDTPAPTKWFSPGLSRLLETAEHKARAKLGLADPAPLSENDEWWLKGADYLEFYLWLCEQENMGNKTLEHPRSVIKLWVAKNRHFLPRPIFLMFEEVFTNGVERMRDMP